MVYFYMVFKYTIVLRIYNTCYNVLREPQLDTDLWVVRLFTSHVWIMKKLLWLCAVRLSILFTGFAAIYKHETTTIPNYDYELVEDEIVTQPFTEEDVPEAEITYSDVGGFKVQVPGELNKYQLIKNTASYVWFILPSIWKNIHSTLTCIFPSVKMLCILVLFLIVL